MGEGKQTNVADELKELKHGYKTGYEKQPQTL